MLQPAVVNADSYGLYITFQGGDVLGVATTTLADIGVDYGSGFQVLIPDLIAGYAQDKFNIKTPGYSYYFPLFIKAGAKLGCRAQQNLSTAYGFNVRVMLMQKPSYPEFVKTGSYVDALGVNHANSRGTVFTPGIDPSMGNWTSLGTAPRGGWFVQGAGSPDGSALASLNYLLDFAVGDASNKRIIIDNQWMGTNDGESVSNERLPHPWGFCSIPDGGELFVRGMANGSGDTVHAAAWVLGGRQ